MTGFLGSPRLRRAGLAVVDPATARPERLLLLQYNPDQLQRSYQLAEGEPKGVHRRAPPAEAIKLEAELDAADQLERGRAPRGVLPQLAALETLLYPSSASLYDAEQLAAAGAIEITAADEPLVLFVWGASRVVPVRVTELSIVEDAFDAELVPIRAKVSLGMRVLTAVELGLRSRGGTIAMLDHQTKERLAGQVGSGDLRLFRGERPL